MQPACRGLPCPRTPPWVARGRVRRAFFPRWPACLHPSEVGVGADGVNGSDIDVDHVGGVNVEPVEHVFGLVGFDGAAEHLAIDAGAQAESYARPVDSSGNVPAFGFAAGLADEAGARVIWMHLDAELFTGKKKLDEQRESSGMRRCFAGEFGSVLRGEIAKSLPGERAVGDTALFSGEPYFADGICFNGTGEVWAQIARAPDPLVKLRKNQKWIEFRHQFLS